MRERENKNLATIFTQFLPPMILNSLFPNHEKMSLNSVIGYPKGHIYYEYIEARYVVVVKTPFSPLARSDSCDHAISLDEVPEYFCNSYLYSTFII